MLLRLLLLGAAQAGADLSPLTPAALQETICAATNAARVAAGLAPLRVEARLHRAAQLQAEQLAQPGVAFGHVVADGAWPTVQDRLRAAGAEEVTRPAENIATWYALRYAEGDGYRVVDAARGEFASQGSLLEAHTPESLGVAAVDGWLASPPHRATLLSPEAEAVGCGAALFAVEGGFPMATLVQVLALAP